MPVWVRRKKGKSISYKLDRKHGVIKTSLDGPPEQKAAVRAVLDLVEKTIPVSMIAIDAYETPEDQESPADERLDAALKNAAESLIKRSLESGDSAEQSRNKIMNLEPFFHYPDVIDEILERLA